MRDIERRRHAARIVDILPGAAGALAVRRLAMIVKLEGDAHDVIALAGQQAGNDRTIDATRHRDDDARVLGALGQDQANSIHISHPVGFKGHFGWRGYKAIRAARQLLAKARENTVDLPLTSRNTEHFLPVALHLL